MSAFLRPQKEGRKESSEPAEPFTWVTGFPNTAGSDAPCTPPIHAPLGGPGGQPHYLLSPSGTGTPRRRGIQELNIELPSPLTDFLRE